VRPRTLARYTSAADPQMGDAAMAQRLTDMQEAIDAVQDPHDASESLPQNMGNTVNVAPFSLENANPISDLVYATFPEARTVTLMLQANPLPDGTAPIQGGVYVTVRATVAGRATFTRSFPLAITGRPKTVRLFARTVDVTVFADQNTEPLVVTGAIVDDQTDALGELWATWVPAAGYGADGITASGLLVPTGGLITQPGTQAGTLLSAQGSLQGGPTSGQKYWVMFFDSNVTPVEDTPPLVAIGPLVGGDPSSYSFDISLRPSIDFSVGLWVALSTTGDLLTTTTDEALVRADVAWGT
jgi:hypothetical protein